MECKCDMASLRILYYNNMSVHQPALILTGLIYIFVMKCSMLNEIVFNVRCSTKNDFKCVIEMDEKKDFMWTGSFKSKELEFDV